MFLKTKIGNRMGRWIGVSGIQAPVLVRCEESDCIIQVQKMKNCDDGGGGDDNDFLYVSNEILRFLSESKSKQWRYDFYCHCL